MFDPLFHWDYVIGPPRTPQIEVQMNVGKISIVDKIVDYMETHEDYAPDHLEGKKKGLAIALISGGMDSITLAYDLFSQGYDLHLLSVNYAQRHKYELTFAQRAAQKLGAKWDLIDLTSIAHLLKGSALSDMSVKVPEGHYSEDTMAITVVPNRNAMMLSVAWAVAIAEKADMVAIAWHNGDFAIYPDCRPDFAYKIERAFQSGNEGIHFCSLYAPYLYKTKAEIVKRSVEVSAPLGYSWSCYKGGEVVDKNGMPIHCGLCSTCTERLEAFYLAGVEDPTEYADSTTWKTVVADWNETHK
jgi:7-cyano-7-deazaguanine synthase